jgi:hypothetical protein
MGGAVGPRLAAAGAEFKGIAERAAGAASAY